MNDNFHNDPYEQYDMAENAALKNGDCPDCGEKNDSKRCCTNN
jgi:hypothetical protein